MYFNWRWLSQPWMPEQRRSIHPREHCWATRGMGSDTQTGRVSLQGIITVKPLHSCQTLWDPVDCVTPGSSVRGIPRQEYRSGLPCTPPGDLPDPGIEPVSLTSPALAGGFFTTRTTSETPCWAKQPIPKGSSPWIPTSLLLLNH